MMAITATILFESKDDVYFTPYGFGAIEIEISEARRRE